MVTVMRIVAVAAILILVLAGPSSLLAAQERQASQTVATYCAGCHNGVTRSPSGALLDRFDPVRISEDLLHGMTPGQWSSIIAGVVRTTPQASQ
jgi:hypothetical protein